MAVSSANISGRAAAVTAADARNQLGDLVEVYLEAGPSAQGAASTIVDLTGNQPRILREGPITAAAIADVLGARGRRPSRREVQRFPVGRPARGPRSVQYISPRGRPARVVGPRCRRSAARARAGRVDRGDHHVLCDGLGARPCHPGSAPSPTHASGTFTCQPTPRMGGLAIYIGIVAAVLLASQLPALTRGFVYSSGMPAVVVAGGLIMAIGLIDDRWGLDALTKFAGQITAASVLVTMGVAWSVLYIPIGGVGTIVLDQVTSILLTLALTVSIVNAMNFVDGLDGLAAGLGLITAAAICIFSIGLLRGPRRRRVVLPARGDLGGARRCVSGLSATQLPPGQDLHGRFRLDADRIDACGCVHHGGGADLPERLWGARRLRPAFAVPVGRRGDVRARPGHVAGDRAPDPRGSEPLPAPTRCICTTGYCRSVIPTGGSCC